MMRTVLGLLLVATTAATGCASSPPPAPAAPAAPRPEVAQVVMVYKGDLGLTLSVLRIGKPEADEVLLKYSGIDHAWSGKVMKAKKVHAGTGFDYRITQASGEYTTLVEREGPLFEVYLPGRDRNGSHVAYDEAASKQASPQGLLDEYLQAKN
jgi:hypothetical protein